MITDEPGTRPVHAADARLQALIRHRRRQVLVRRAAVRRASIAASFVVARPHGT